MDKVKRFVYDFYWFLTRRSIPIESAFWLVSLTLAYGFSAGFMLTLIYLLVSFVATTPWFTRLFYRNMGGQPAGLVVIKVGLVTLMATGLALPFAMQEGFLASVLIVLFVHAMAYNTIFSMFEKATYETIHSGFSINYRDLLHGVICTASLMAMTFSTVKIEPAYFSGICFGFLATIVFGCLVRISDTWTYLESSDLVNGDLSLKNRLDKIYSY
jgi:hypothetical protein